MTDVSVPGVVLGTMTFGQQVEEAAAAEMVEGFFARGGVELDTAYVYSEGRSEEILGRLLKGRARDSYRVATKAAPQVTGRLDAESVTMQLETSLKRMQLESVDLFYLHLPDLDTPIEKTLDACAGLHRRGLFEALGLSNYAAWQVADIVHTCRREGWPVPAVYQGMYNAITRDVERELFPCLRALGLSFYAYNPLAGGVLSGRYEWRAIAPDEGRFREYGFYVDRYWKESYVTAAAEVARACEGRGIAEAAAALRWLARDSMLKASAGDAVIIGASKLDHAEENQVACGAAPVPECVSAAFDNAWEAARADCPKYFRP